MWIFLSKVAMKVMFIFHGVISVTVSRRFLPTFKCIHCFTALNYREFLLQNVSKNYHHHHKHPGLGHLVRSVSRVTVAVSIVSSVSQLFSSLVGCSGMILKGFGFVAWKIVPNSIVYHRLKFARFFDITFPISLK